MSKTVIQNLEVEVPDVVVETRVATVRCGNTNFEVSERGRVGSGEWAVWSGGHTRGDKNLTYADAIEQARQMAEHAEIGRLLHGAVTDAQEAGE